MGIIIHTSFVTDMFNVIMKFNLTDVLYRYVKYGEFIDKHK